MSNQPSEAALAFAGKIQEALLLDVNLYDQAQDDVARLLDAFAAQAVAAERARITKDVAGAARRYAGTVSTKPFEGGWKEGALHFAETARQIVNQTKKEKA